MHTVHDQPLAKTKWQQRVENDQRGAKRYQRRRDIDRLLEDRKLRKEIEG